MKFILVKIPGNFWEYQLINATSRAEDVAGRKVVCIIINVCTMIYLFVILDSS